MYLETEVSTIAHKSRAEYFKKRRENLRQFNVTLPKERIEALEIILSKQKKTKTQWLDEKISEDEKKE